MDILSLPDVNPAYAAYQRDLDDRLKLMHCHLFATCFESEEFDAIAQCARDLSVKQYSAVVPSNYERCHQSRRVSNCDEFLSKKGCGSKWAVRFYTERELREWLKSSQAEYERYSKESKP